MSANAAFLVFVLYIAWLVAMDVRRRDGLSWPLWMVVVWVALLGSRPVATWLVAGTGSGSLMELYDEGNPVERASYSVMILVGVFVLRARGVNPFTVFMANKWLCLFFIYWGVSALWADVPFLAFKRWVKDIGNLVMVMIIITEKNPVEAAKAVFVRCACLLLPMSILFIKFFPDLGRNYHVWSGEMMFTGVTTHKNSLGMLAMVCGGFLAWDFLERLRDKAQPRNWIGIAGDLSLIAIALWLLQTSRSATALACAVAGVALYVVLRLQGVRRRIWAWEFFAVAVVTVAWATGLAAQVSNYIVVDVLSRDLTLTTRTEVWPVLTELADSVVVGSGFNSFWSGDRLAYVYSKFAIIQAHNGYLDTYLNGGLIAVFLLGMLLLAAGRTINREVVRGSEYATFKLVVFAIALVYNLAEAAFDKMTPLWFALLVVMMQYPARQAMKSPAVFQPGFAQGPRIPG